MAPIFSKSVSRKWHLIIAILFALALLIMDGYWGMFTQIRSYLDTTVSPLYFIADLPNKVLDTVAEKVTTKEKLLAENEQLEQKLLLSHSELLKFAQLERENQHLRALLRAPLRENEHKALAQVISTEMDPYSDQVVLNRGKSSQVYQGQPVISDKGVIGQVMSVGQFSSRILLLCDTASAIPVQLLRNDVRAVASGNGCNKDLQLEYFPTDSDIKVGDQLVTSGLGGRFPEGYPVAVVSSVRLDPLRATTVILARPTAQLQRMRYLLLVWEQQNNQQRDDAEQVASLALQRQQMWASHATDSASVASVASSALPLMPVPAASSMATPASSGQRP